MTIYEDDFNGGMTQVRPKPKPQPKVAATISGGPDASRGSLPKTAAPVPAAKWVEPKPAAAPGPVAGPVNQAPAAHQGPAAPLAPVGQIQTNPMFALQRKRAEQSAETSGQRQNDAIQRRFAAMGGLNSGAFMKAQESGRDAAMNDKQQAMEGINAQEAADVARQQEVLSGREFARSERLGSQDFSSSERRGAQNFSRLERLDTQKFSAGETALMRQFESFYKDQDNVFRNEALAIDTRLKELGLGVERDKVGISAVDAQATLDMVDDDEMSPGEKAKYKRKYRDYARGE